jgi:DNA-binding NarL/FixJ family response regulator
MRIAVVKSTRLAIDQIVQAVNSAGVMASEIVGYQTAGEAWEVLRARPVQLGIFGLTLPDWDGLDLVRRVLEQRRVWRVLVVSSRRDERVRQLVRPGWVDGYLNPGTDDFACLVSAIRQVAEDGFYFSRDHVAPAAGSRTQRPALKHLFSERQLRVLAVVGDGCDDRQAAERLDMQAGTVNWHRKEIMRKLGVQTRPELMREAIRCGVVRVATARMLHPGFEKELGAREDRLEGAGVGSSESRSTRSQSSGE